MPQNLTYENSTLIQVMAWCHQAQAITWAKVDPDLCCQIASVSHNGLMYHLKFNPHHSYLVAMSSCCSSLVLTSQLKSQRFWQTSLQQDQIMVWCYQHVIVIRSDFGILLHNLNVIHLRCFANVSLLGAQTRIFLSKYANTIAAVEKIFLKIFCLSEKNNWYKFSN